MGYNIQKLSNQNTVICVQMTIEDVFLKPHDAIENDIAKWKTKNQLTSESKCPVCCQQLRIIVLESS